MISKLDNNLALAHELNGHTDTLKMRTIRK